MDIKIIIYTFLLFSFSFVAIKYFINVAPKIGLVDVPNDRSSHKRAIPRGAGIVIGSMFFIGMFFFETKLSLELIYPMIAFMLVFLCGIVDDFKELGSKVKFLFIIIATIILYFNGYSIDYVGTYFSYEFNLGYLALPFTVFAFVGFTNGLNLIDGLDGLAGGVSSIVLTALLIVGIQNNDQILIVIPSFLLAIIFAFLLFNWSPARVFMGDSGSLFLGFMISFLSFKALDYVTPTSILFLAAIPILDTMVVIRRRLQRKESPFMADKNHIHHILYNMKRHKPFTVNTIIVMQLAFALIFLQVINSNDIINIILFLILYHIFFNLFDPRRRKRHEKKKKKKKKKFIILTMLNLRR